MANNCKQCSIRIISHTTTPLPKAYDCVAVYIAGRRTSLVVYGWWPQPPTKKVKSQKDNYASKRNAQENVKRLKLKVAMQQRQRKYHNTVVTVNAGTGI